MIAYRISEQELLRRIKAEKASWLKRAEKRTEKFRRLRTYSEESSIWSEIKPVYIRLQHEKCAFCERKLEAIERGLGEHDVEHFRPKGAVTAWRGESAEIPEPTSVNGLRGGYYLLSYNPLNYAAACGPCNSVLKSDRFPILGSYNLLGEDPRDLLDSEKPLLLFPLGDWEKNPEEAMEFFGVSPVARATEPSLRQRALATIEFFELDSASTRKNLVVERAMIIAALFPQLENLQEGRGNELAKRVVDAYTAPQAPHTNCSRSYCRLHSQDRQRAKQLFDESVGVIETRS